MAHNGERRLVPDPSVCDGASGHEHVGRFARSAVAVDHGGNVIVRASRASPHGFVLQEQLVVEFPCSLQQRWEVQTESRLDVFGIPASGN